jgi:hypothetical protein
MTHAEALSIHSTAALREKILSKELRQLHSVGIQEIAKFYDRHFKIKFSECMQGIGSLWEIHERRHVLVHRLGRADQQYRHKYHYTKKAPLTVEPSYLRDAFAVIESLVESVVKKATEVASAQQEGITAEPATLEVELEVAAASEAAGRLLSRRFHFVVNSRTAGDRTVALSDILVLSRKGEQGRVLVLSGEREDVRGYLNEIKKCEKKGLLSVLGITIHGQASELLSEPRDSTLPLATLEEIARRLPKRPWPKSIHKEVARAIGVSNTQCSRAMTQILNDERLLSLVAT